MLYIEYVENGIVSQTRGADDDCRRVRRERVSVSDLVNANDIEGTVSQENIQTSNRSIEDIGDENLRSASPNRVWSGPKRLIQKSGVDQISHHISGAIDHQQRTLLMALLLLVGTFPTSTKPARRTPSAVVRPNGV